MTLKEETAPFLAERDVEEISRCARRLAILCSQRYSTTLLRTLIIPRLTITWWRHPPFGTVGTCTWHVRFATCLSHVRLGTRVMARGWADNLICRCHMWRYVARTHARSPGNSSTINAITLRNTIFVYTVWNTSTEGNLEPLDSLSRYLLNL